MAQLLRVGYLKMCKKYLECNRMCMTPNPFYKIISQRLQISQLKSLGPFALKARRKKKANKK